MAKTDVCVIYYGKPYQTIISILTLLKFSRQHINKLYMTVEQRQPHDRFGDVYQVLKAIRPHIEIDLYYPKYFYELGFLDYEQTRADALYRWQIPYQYALEKASCDYLFIMHNDMVFSRDMIGDMLPAFDLDEKLAGTGSIGQCWSCPGFSARLCHGAIMHQFVPSQQEALELHQRFDTPRKEKDIEIINTGRFYPMPECRLNEYCCLINLDLYRKETLPVGDGVCFGGNWGFTADLGTGWFYQMVNKGYHFKHFVLEDYAQHSSFNPVGQGIHAYSKKDNYLLSEENALKYLIENFDADAFLDLKYKIFGRLRVMQGKAERKQRFYEHKVKKVFKMVFKTDLLDRLDR